MTWLFTTRVKLKNKTKENKYIVGICVVRERIVGLIYIILFLSSNTWVSSMGVTSVRVCFTNYY